MNCVCIYEAQQCEKRGFFVLFAKSYGEMVDYYFAFCGGFTKTLDFILKSMATLLLNNVNFIIQISILEFFQENLSIKLSVSKEPKK
jgi:hypothetical protein